MEQQKGPYLRQAIWTWLCCFCKAMLQAPSTSTDPASGMSPPDRLSDENARQLLTLAYQQRVHWSHVITLHLTVVLTVVVGIWSYFLKAVVDAMTSDGQSALYIVIAASFSSLLVSLWRLYAKYLDNNIAGLY